MHPSFKRASGLTESVIAAAIEVHRDKGPGLIESIYEWCLTKEFELRGLRCVSQKIVVITYKIFSREEPLRFDMLVEDCVLVEAKSRGEDSTYPQSSTPELHETAGYPDWVTHQLPRDETDRRSASPYPSRREPMNSGVQQEKTEGTETQTEISVCS